MLIRQTAILLFFVLCFFQADAQQSWTIYNTSNSPLPDNSVRAIATDQLGRKWIATDNGLALFDDVNWTIFDTSNSDIPDNNVRTVSVDRFNRVWVGTFTKGMAVYDGNSWQNWNSNNSPMPNDFVRSIAFDSFDHLWIGTADGLVHYDSTNWQTWNLSNSILLSSNISCVVVRKTDNHKFLCTINGGLYDLHDTTWTRYTIAETNIPDNSAVQMVLDTNGNRWYASPAAGLLLHYQTPSVWSFFNTVNSAIVSNALTSIAIDSSQKLFMGSMQLGLAMFSWPATWTHYSTGNSPLPDDYVQCVLKPNLRTLWIGTQSGGLVRVEETTSIAESGEQISFSIYPNPAESGNPVFTALPADDYLLGITDASGRTVLNEKNSGLFFNAPAGLSPGMYFVTFYGSKKQVYRSKLIIR